MQNKVSLKKMQWLLYLLGLFKIPLIGFVRPKLVSITEEEVIVRIKFRRRTKNHLSSMYFGALAVGADIAAGIHAFYFSKTMGLKVSFAFKGMNAEFLKRAETDVVFKIDQGLEVKKAIVNSKQTGCRNNIPVNVIALNKMDEVVATFEMIVSVKVK